MYHSYNVIIYLLGMSESCGAHCVNQSTEDHWKVGSAGKGLMAVATKLHDTDSNGEGEVKS